MSRSIWKNPFIDKCVISKVDKYVDSGKKGGVINIMSRRSTIIPDFVGLVFGVYNGKKFVPVVVNEMMVGHKFGEFSPTRTYYGHGADKKMKRKK